MNKKIRYALLGTGVMGKKYADMLNNGEVKNAELTILCTRSEESFLWASENLSNSIKIVRSIDEVYKSSDLYDAIIIAVPHKMHPEIAIKSFAMGKHVLCDKPSGVTVNDARKMLEESIRTNMKYGVIFHNRTYPVIKALKQIIYSEKLGILRRIMLENTIYYRTAYYHKSGSWRSSWNGEGGGLLINQGQHIIDYWLWLFGMPKSIYANVKFGKYNNFTVDDEATIVMNYDDDLSGVFILSTGEIPREEKLKIIGTKGAAIMDGNKITIETYSREQQEYSNNAKVTSREEISTSIEVLDFNKDNREPYIKILENFANAVLYDEELIADGRDGLNTLEITNGAYISAWKNQVLTLPVSDGDEYQKMLEEQMLIERNKTKEY